MVGRWCTPERSHRSGYLRLRVCHPPTRTHVRLLGPCFKTGRAEALRQRLECAGAEARVRAHFFLSPHRGAKLLPRREPALANTPRRRRTSRPFRLWPGCTHCRCTLTPQQFQALFNSLSKVLFIFPSRYLFAIGLSPVFSLRWNLPPN